MAKGKYIQYVVKELSVKRMKMGIEKCTIVYFLIATLLLGISVGVVFGSEQVEEKKQYDILFLGDSLIGQYRDETSVPYLVGEALGKTTFNGAFGGTTMTGYPRLESDYYQRYGLNFPSLVKAICTGDFSVQKSLKLCEPGTAEFNNLILELSAIDFERLELLVLEYGTNDYFAGVPILGETQTDTFVGSFVSGIDLLKERFPDLRIVVVGPTFNWYYLTNQNCEEIEFGGGYMSDYAIALGETCTQYQLEYVDLMTLYNTDFSIHEANLYTDDGVHPNEYGRKLIADEIVKYLTQ